MQYRNVTDNSEPLISAVFKKTHENWLLAGKCNTTLTTCHNKVRF
jgi:hypothetical protein